MRQRRPRLRLVLSGALFGIATFGYFVIGFFLPAMIWLALRRDPADEARPTRRWRAPALWLGGVVVGELPFIVGIVLLAAAVGGLGPLADYVSDQGSELKAVGELTGGSDPGGPLRASARCSASLEHRDQRVAELQILRLEHSGALDAVKAGLWSACPCSASPCGSARAPNAARSPYRSPDRLVPGRLVHRHLDGLQGRLGGHHLPALMPLLLAFGWPAPPCGKRRRRRMATCGWAPRSSRALDRLVSQEQLHNLSRTGAPPLLGRHDRFAASVNRETQNATIHAPDYGSCQPLASSAAPRQSAKVDMGEIQSLGCSGQAAAESCSRRANERRLALLSRRSPRPRT